MIPFRRRVTGLLEVLIGLGLMVGFIPPSTLLDLNPSPFFAIVLYGAWVAGAWVGLAAGGLAAAIYLILLTENASYPIEVFGTFLISDPKHYLTPMFLMIGGYVFGELRMQWERRLARLQDQANISHQEAAKAAARLQQAEAMLGELQGRVLGQTATIKRLYGIAQSLNVLSVDQILLELMGVLTDLLQVEQASIYRLEESQLYARLSVRVGQPEWANSLAVKDHELVGRVVREGRLLTFADSAPGDAPIYLVPIFRASRTYALIAIHRLPLAKITMDTKELLAILAQWAGDSLERATSYEQASKAEATFPDSRVLRKKYFKEQCALEEERSKRYGIPFVLLELGVRTTLPDAQVPSVLTDRLKGAIRAFDMVMYEPEVQRCSILLPTLEADWAEQVAERILSRLDGSGLNVELLDARMTCRQEESSLPMREGVVMS